MRHHRFLGAAGAAVLALALFSSPHLRGQEPGVFKGRPVADVMSYRGAPWLEREGRENEEDPAALLAALPIEPGDRVADMGCGSGYYARRLSPRVGPSGLVYCVDIQPEMIAIATRLAEEARVTNLRTILATESDPRLPAGSLDLILLVDVYHEMSDPAAMLEAMKSALAEDGVVALAEFRLEGDSAAHIKLDHRMSVEQVLAEWLPAGFELVETIESLPTQHLFLFKKAAPTPKPSPGGKTAEGKTGSKLSAANRRFLAMRPTARIQSNEIAESSGLVASRNFPGVFWTHNDSGDRSRLFALKPDGALIAEVSVIGASHKDWEDLAVDDHRRLYIGDIGNNANQRRDLVVYVVAEPDPHASSRNGAPIQVAVERTVRFRYPELPYPPPPQRRNFDAESLFVADERLYLLTKHRSNTRTRLYRFPESESSAAVVLEPIGEFDLGGGNRPLGGMATGADTTSDGKFLAVLSYHAIFIFERPEVGDDYLAHPILELDLSRAGFRQCESIAWLAGDLWVGNEQRDLYRIKKPLAP